MNKNEFLRTLRESLSGSLEKEDLNSQLDYYEKYIADEIQNGKTEKEVIEDLGDPRLIAKTIKTVTANDSENLNNTENRSDDFYNDTSYTDSSNSKKSYQSFDEKHNSSRNSYMNFGGQNTTIGCIIILLVIFIIVYGIFSYIGRIAFSGPIGFLLVFGLFYYLFGRRK